MGSDDTHPQQQQQTQQQQAHPQQQQDGQDLSLPAKKPPGTWTLLETSHLIDAYQEKWYALKRGQLRTRHWDEVAEALASRCAGLDPAKTSMQCRHKMEKLRRKYRAERQILLRKGGPAQWPFYEKMDRMEKGPGDVSSLAGVHGGSAAAAAAAVAAAAAMAGGSLLEGRKREFLRSDLYRASRDRDRDRELQREREREREKERERERKRELQDHESTMSLNDEGDDSEPPQDLSDDDPLGDNDGSYASLNGKHGMSFDYDPASSHKMHDHRFPRIPTKPSSRHQKRPAESAAPLADLVSAVRWLGEGFLRMEQMKLQMQRENERQRVDMELRRTEMVLNCQRQIAEVFTKTLVSSKKSKKSQSQVD